MADDIVINTQPKLGMRAWLSELVVHPTMRSKQKRFTGYVQLQGVDYSNVFHSDDPVPQVNTSSFRNRIAGAFRKKYLGDGYDLPTNTIQPLKNRNHNVIEAVRTEPYIGEHVGHSIATFFGVPNRFDKTDSHGKPVFNGWTILKNYLGGWTPLVETMQVQNGQEFKNKWVLLAGERTFWAILALPVKFLIILPIKLALTPVKFALNIIKLFTELLPEILATETGLMVNKLFKSISNNWEKPLLSDTGHELDRNATTKPRKVIAISLLILAAIIPLALHGVARVWNLLGTAFTSPEHSAKAAWDYAHRLDIKRSPNLTAFLQKAFGLVGGLLSVALTIALWSIALPFAIGSIVKYVPQFMTAVNWVLSTPLIAPALAYVNGVLTVIGGWLAVFTPLVSTISASIGIQVTTAMLAVGVSLASISGLLAPIFSRVADALSNWYAQRGLHSGPFTTIRNALNIIGVSKRPSSVPLEEEVKLDGRDMVREEVEFLLTSPTGDQNLVLDAEWNRATNLAGSRYTEFFVSITHDTADGPVNAVRPINNYAPMPAQQVTNTAKALVAQARKVTDEAQKREAIATAKREIIAVAHRYEQAKASIRVEEQGYKATAAELRAIAGPEESAPPTTTGPTLGSTIEEL